MSSSLPILDCSLAIPCYKESGRLPPFLDELAATVSKSKRSIHLQLIDDGSGEAEQTALIGVAKQIGDKHKLPISTHILSENRGKGFAVRHGWQNAPEAKFLGFVDADGAVPAREVVAVLERALETPDELTIGSRYLMGKKVSRRRLRRLYSFGFRRLFRFLYRIDCTDTQCGLKFIPQSLFRNNQHEFYQNRWGFDLELILKAADRGVAIKEVAIDWTEKPGSKVRLGNVLPLVKDMLTDRI